MGSETELLTMLNDVEAGPRLSTLTPKHPKVESNAAAVSPVAGASPRNVELSPDHLDDEVARSGPGYGRYHVPPRIGVSRFHPPLPQGHATVAKARPKWVIGKFTGDLLLEARITTIPTDDEMSAERPKLAPRATSRGSETEPHSYAGTNAGAGFN